MGGRVGEGTEGEGARGNRGERKGRAREEVGGSRGGFVPASEEALDLSPLSWSRVKRLPEAIRTSHTLTMLSELRKGEQERQ